MTQGQALIELLKKQRMTSMELLQTGISTCWWKRCEETLRHDTDWALNSLKGPDGLNRYWVYKVKK